MGLEFWEVVDQGLNYRATSDSSLKIQVHRGLDGTVYSTYLTCLAVPVPRYVFSVKRQVSNSVLHPHLCGETIREDFTWE